MYTIRRFENWGVDNSTGPLSREATTLLTATTQKLFATIPGWQRNNRQGVSICFLSTTAADAMYIRIVARGAAAPPVSSTNCDYVIAANQTVPVQCGPGVDIYVRHSAAGTLNYTASEFA
jgi:hypothetical protein